MKHKHAIKIRELRNLGDKSAKQLAAIGIKNAAQLQEMGAAKTYVKLKQHDAKGISLNFLYAIEGALNEQSCLTLSAEQKLSLQWQVEAIEEAYQRLEQIN